MMTQINLFKLIFVDNMQNCVWPYYHVCSGESYVRYLKYEGYFV